MKQYDNQIIDNLIMRFPELSGLPVHRSVEAICSCYRDGGKLLICGNGGSAADALHITGELMKGFILERPIDKSIQEKIRTIYPAEADYLISNLQGALPAISLVSEAALISAFSNDKAADLCFAQQVMGHGMKGDVLIAISTSGNAVNVRYAAQIAKVKQMTVIALTGDTGGDLKNYADILLNVPAKETYLVQEYHLPLYHAICAAVEKALTADI